jgi:hypothetical protein
MPDVNMADREYYMFFVLWGMLGRMLKRDCWLRSVICHRKWRRVGANIGVSVRADDSSPQSV